MASTQPESLSHFGAGEASASARKRLIRISDSVLAHVQRHALQIPGEVWTRVVALFLVLAGIKILLLTHLNKQLFEVHWRTNDSGIEPLDYLNFGMFIFIGSLSLARLAHTYRAKGPRTARLANIGILILAAPFLFLTFHQGNNNYLYPILSGVLKWSSLTPYLADDLFFNPPFLFLWIAAYAIGYWMLRRSGRESYCMYLTAGFGAAYAPTFLSHLAGFRNEILALNTIGAICLIASILLDRPPGATWLLGPWMWTSAGAAMILAHAPANLGLPLKYFGGLFAAVAVLLGAASLLAKKDGVAGDWWGFAFFYAAAFLLLADTRFPVASNFNKAICSGLTFPRYFLGELGICGGLLFASAILPRFLPKVRLVCLDVLAIAMMAITIVDYRVLQIMGVRLEWSVLELGNSPKMMWRMARPYLPMLGLALVGIAGVYVGITYLISKAVRSAECGARNAKCQKSSEPRIQNAESKSSAPNCLGGGLGLVGALFLGTGLLGLVIANSDKAEGQAVVRLVASGPIWSGIGGGRMSPEDFRRAAAELELGNMEPAPAAATTPRRDLNVVLVFMESTYNKHLSLFGSEEESQPLLSKYRDRMELYPNFFSTFASSIHARFATFCSLYPTRDFNEFTIKRVGVKSIFEILHENGYETSLFYSSFLDFTGFRDFLANREIDHLYDADTMPGQRHTERVSWGLQEEETLGAMREHIKECAGNGKKFFLTYVPAAPHYPYDKVPERFHRYAPTQVGDYAPMYLNELLYMDWVLASLVDELKESGLLDKTLVVITDDHGEMLGGKGKPIGHGWLLSPELVNAPLIIMDPDRKSPRVNHVFGCQVDLLPTLLDRLGIEAPQKDLYQGHSLDRGASNRTMYLNSYQQYAVLEGNRLCFGDREKPGAQECYLIENEGAKTRFVAVPASNAARDISRFDRFQENFLKNYRWYTDIENPVRLTRTP